MSFLKDLNLKKKQTTDPKEIDLDGIQFLFEKKRNSNRSKKADIVSINKGSIAIRHEVCERIGIEQPKGSGSLILHEGQICLLIHPKKNFDSLYKIVWGDATKQNRYTVYINVPKDSQHLIEKFKGNYVVGDVHNAVEGLKICTLIKTQ